MCTTAAHARGVPSNASGNRKSLARWMLKLLCHQPSCNVIRQFITAWHLPNEIFVRYTTNRVTFVRFLLFLPLPLPFRTEQNLFSNSLQDDPNPFERAKHFRMHCTLSPLVSDASPRCLQLWLTKAGLLVDEDCVFFTCYRAAVNIRLLRTHL